jgi:hypothetical protein
MRNIMRADLMQGSGLVPVGLASLSGLQQYRAYVDECGVEYASDWFTYTVTIPTLAAGASKTAVLNIQSDSAFEWLETAAQVFNSTGNTLGGANQDIEITIVDSASSRNLMNAAVPIGLYAGAGGLPFVNPIPRRFMPQTQVTVVAHNYSAGTTFGTTASGAAQLSFIGRKIFTARPSGPGWAGARLARFNAWADPNTGRTYSEDLYSYVFKYPSTIAHGTSLDKTIIIEADSNFEWISSSFGWTDNAGAMKTADQITATVQVLDGGTNRQLLSQASSLLNIAGASVSTPGGAIAIPQTLLQPRLFQSKAPVTVTIADTDSAADMDLAYFVMHGRKIFELG